MRRNFISGKARKKLEKKISFIVLSHDVVPLMCILKFQTLITVGRHQTIRLTGCMSKALWLVAIGSSCVLMQTGS